MIWIITDNTENNEFVTVVFSETALERTKQTLINFDSIANEHRHYSIKKAVNSYNGMAHIVKESTLDT